MRKRSLRFQMVIALLMMIVIMAAFAQKLYAYYSEQYSSRLLKTNADIAAQLKDNLSAQYVTFSNAIDSFAINATVERFLSTESNYEKVTLMPLYENLQQSYKQMNGGINSIVLKKKDGSIFSDPSGNAALNIADTAPAFSRLENESGLTLIVSRNKAYIAMKRDVYRSGHILNQVGSCMFVIYAEAFLGNLSATNVESRKIYVFDAESRLIASNCGMAPGTEAPERFQVYLHSEQGQSFQFQDQDYIAYSQRDASTQWTILCLTPTSVLFSSLNGIKHTTTFLMLSMLVLVSVVYLTQTVAISRSFRKFIKHIHLISRGETVPPLKLHFSAEFRQLADAFNTMMEQLDALNQSNLEYHEKMLLKDIENKQSQLLALQSQINPHFLYNTLECINSAGAVCGSREVEEMSTALAYIFRYAIKGDRIVTLADEIETLRYYLNIQQLRFPNMFTVSYDIAPDIFSRRMLKFLLQPLVENSISHGFKEHQRQNSIRISAWEAEKKLILEIADNGRGMPASDLEALRNTLNQPAKDTSSIGLMNIQRRIRLYYGENYGMSIDGAEGMGLTITVTLPLLHDGQAEEEPDV